MDHDSADRTATALLLAGMLAGAEQRFASAGDWAARLSSGTPTPVAARFIAQLHGEWPPALPPDGLCEAVTVQVQARLAAWHPGWPHLWAHVLRVTATALVLAAAETVDPALAYLAGICHDVAKLDEILAGRSHEELGADFAGRVLEGHLPPAQIASIQAAITRQGGDPLAAILHDADKLDKIGAAGVLRRVSVTTRLDWLPPALERVHVDWMAFPPMQGERGRVLADSKSGFLAWFLPLAQAAISE